MPRLLGFNRTKKMLMEEKALLNTNLSKVDSQVLVDVIHNGPILETKLPEDIQSIEIPIYTRPVKLSEMPSEIKDYSNVKRSVNLNPLSDE